MPSRNDPSHETAGVLGAGNDLAAWLDPLSLGRSTAKVIAALTRRPNDAAEAVLRWSRLVLQANYAAAATGLGLPAAAPLAPDANDRRFDDAAWRDNAAFDLLEQRLPDQFAADPRVGRRRGRRSDDPDQGRPSRQHDHRRGQLRPTCCGPTRPRCTRRSKRADSACGGADATSSEISPPTGAGPAKSTPQPSDSAAIWRPPLARSSIETN